MRSRRAPQRGELAWALILLLPFAVVVLISPYAPSTDEAWQLHAAGRLAGGLGYTTYPYWAIPADLSRVSAAHLIAWPPGYSFAIALLMKLGLSLLDAARAFKVVLLVAAATGWWRLATRLVDSPLVRCLFVAYVGFSASFFSLWPSDLFCWALMPLLTELMLDLDASSARTLAVGSGLIVAMVVMRYQCLFLLPAVALWCLVWGSSSPLRVRLARAAALVLPATVAFAAIAAANLAAASRLSTMTNKPPAVGFQWFWLRDTARTAMFGPFFGHQLLAKLHLGSRGWFTAAGALGWIALLAFTWLLRKQAASDDPARSRLAKWLALCGAILLAFLGTLTVTQYGDVPEAAIPVGDGVPLTYARYYWIGAPLVLLVVLFALERSRLGRLPPKSSRLIGTLALVIALLAACNFSWRRYRERVARGRTATALAERLDRIAARERSASLVVFADDDYLTLLLPGARAPLFRYPDDDPTARTFFSDRTTLAWALVAPDTFRWRSAPGMHAESVDGAALYWRTFPPGPFRPDVE